MNQSLKKKPSVHEAALVEEMAKDAEPEITEERAQAYLLNAGMPGVNLSAWINKKIVGQYLARGLAGNIISRSVMQRQDLDANMAAMSKIIQQKTGATVTTEEMIGAAIAYDKLMRAGIERDVADLKAAELASLGTQKQKRHNLAPQVRASKVTIHNDNRQQTLVQGAKE